MKEAFIEKRFSDNSLAIIAKAAQICNAYMEDGLKLTLRQLYYQFVSMDLIPNKQAEYNRLGRLMNDARLAGYIDWEAIEDRTRRLEENAHWRSPSEILQACAKQFQYDKWEGQVSAVEVWVEKDALIGVVGRTCQELDVPYTSCRGYISQSELYDASKRILERQERWEQGTIILHFGDHDPSGIDMTRDIRDRLWRFGCDNMEVVRVALNFDQVEEHRPPPNPAKITDSRAAKYIRDYGRSSWELDALNPRVLDALIRDNVDRYIDQELFDKRKAEEDEVRKQLRQYANNWE